ncbi:MAG: ATP synthase F1 subunit delta [Candidatus Manganitrophaceae bacterium]
MKSEVLAERYAEALLEVTEERALGQTALEQLEQLRLALDQFPSANRFLENPRIPEEKKIALLSRTLEGDVQKIFITFVRLLLRKGRIGYLRSILAVYPKLYDARRGVLKGTVTTAYPLDSEATARLKSKLETEMDRSLELNYLENSELIGGFIFSTGTTLVDASIQRQLVQLRERLKAVPIS